MDKAFDRARAAYGTGAYDDATLEFIFPQLKESEDERIRKRMIEHFKSKTKDTWCNMPVKSILDWLEKQKEASKAIEAVDRIDKFINEHLANAHDMKDSNSEKEYYLGWDAALGKMSGILQDVYSGEKQKEQPEEELVYRLNGLMQEYIKEGKDEAEKEHRFKCYQLFWDALEDANFFEQKEQKEQKPAWSEEDEKMLNLTKMQLRILQSHLNHTHSENMADTEYSSRLLQIEKCVSWLDIRLKHLRPSWKPSEEQMKHLERCFSHGHTSQLPNQHVLESLHHDLQKLL